MNKPVAIYTRVSTDGQEDGTSLDTQRQSCLEYCRVKGYTPAYQFSETWSGLSLNRPKLDELRELVRNEQVRSIVIHSLDRLSRDPVHGVILIQEIEIHHGTLEAVTEDIDNSDLGKMISYIRGYAAKLEAEKIRERTGRGIKARVMSKGLPVTFRNPFGFDWDRSGDKPKLVPNESYQTAELIINWALEGKSYDYVIAELHKKGIPSPEGKEKWNKASLSRMVHDPVYTGTYCAFKTSAREPITRGVKLNGQPTYGKTSVTRLPQSQWHPIPDIEVVNPVLTPEQQALLQEQLIKRRNLSQRNAHADYLLRGMIHCDTHKGIQGRPLIYHGRPRTPDSYCYVCQVSKCENGYINGPWADGYVKNFLRQFLIQSEDKFYKSIYTDNNQIKAIDRLKSRSKGLQKEYENLINKMAKLEDDNYDNKIDSEAYQSLKVKYTNRKQGIKGEQDMILEQMAITNRDNDAIESWRGLRDKFIDRLIGPSKPLSTERTAYLFKKKYEAEISLALKDKGCDIGSPEVVKAIKDLAKVKAENTAAYLADKEAESDNTAEPLTKAEWRELLTTFNFQWVVHENDTPDAAQVNSGHKYFKLLARTEFKLDIPLKNTRLISDIALGMVEQAKHNITYYPVSISPFDFNLQDIIGDKVLSHKGGDDG